MAQVSTTNQYKHTVSIPRDGLKKIAKDSDLSKKELRVLFALFTELNGFDSNASNRQKDPENFKLIDFDEIADFLNIDYKEVKKVVKKLMIYDYIEKGSSETTGNGYRFTF